MEHPGFFIKSEPVPLGELASAAGAEFEGDGARLISDVKPLDAAGPSHASFFENTRYLAQFTATRAGAVFVHPKHASKTPPDTAALLARDAYRAFAKALWLFYPGAVCSKAGFEGQARTQENGALIHPSAELEEGVRIEAGAIIGEGARIGSGTTIAAGAVIGYRVYIGRDCYVGPRASLTHALIGNNVIIHAGVSIGQDGFGFAMGASGHFKVPQIGRVIIQDHVEIGANSAVDRGALRDTMIGEGTKIDNLVQIGHNVSIGRHCVIVGQCGIAGSSQLGDFVVMGGQAGIVGHVQIGAGAQIAGGSGVAENVPAGERWGGTPAKPLGLWAREVAILRKLSQGGRKGRQAGPDAGRSSGAGGDDDGGDGNRA